MIVEICASQGGSEEDEREEAAAAGVALQ